MDPSSIHDQRRPDWWLDDLPPLGGGLRLFFYGSLLILSLRNLKSPLAGLGFYEQTDPALFQPYGLFEWLGVAYVSPSLLLALTAVTVVAWTAAALGHGGHLAAIATAGGATALHGMYLGSNSLNHYYFLPIYCLVALCFAKPLTQQQPESGEVGRLGHTGLARKLALFAAIGFYFAAGISKLVNSGLAWADGESILYFCELRRGVYPLADLMLAQPWIARVGAVGTLVLEVGAPLALLSRPLRHLWVVGLVGMHVVIRYTMGPAYWPNVICLALLIDWEWIVSLAKGAAATKPLPTSRTPRTQAIGRGVGVAALMLALLPATTGLFWWPLTNVYMYCSYFSVEKDFRSGRPRLDYYHAESVQLIAKHFRKAKPPREVAEYLGFRVALRLATDDAPPHYLYDGPTLGVATWKQLVLTVLTPVLIDDLSAKSPGRIEHVSSGPPLPAQRFLLSYAEVLKKRLPAELKDRYDRVELVYPIADAAIKGVSAGELPDAVRQEYATLEPTLPSGLRMVVLAAAPLQANGVPMVAER